MSVVSSDGMSKKYIPILLLRYGRSLERWQGLSELLLNAVKAAAPTLDTTLIQKTPNEVS